MHDDAFVTQHRENLGRDVWVFASGQLRSGFQDRHTTAEPAIGLRQLQADIFGVTAHRTSADEGPAYGAALLAGVAAGAYAGAEEALALIQDPEDVTEPDRAAAARYDELHAIYDPLYQAMRNGMLSLADFADATADPSVPRG